MFEPAKSPIRASTQDHLNIEDIRDDLVILKDGSSVLVMTTTAINFGLLSEREQDATIYAYAALLNSLTFSIQILIRSQKKDISGYLKLLDQAEARETKKKIREQISKYKAFIQETVAKNEVLDKKFYIVIPMSALEIGATQSFGSSIKRKEGLPFPKEYILEKAKSNLMPKRDHLLKLLGRLGLRARQLTTQELIQLFYEIYNPESGTQPVGQKAEYQVPIVQAARVVSPPTDTAGPASSEPAAPANATAPMPNQAPAVQAQAQTNQTADPQPSTTPSTQPASPSNDPSTQATPNQPNQSQPNDDLLQSTQSNPPQGKDPNKPSGEINLQEEINNLVKKSAS